MNRATQSLDYRLGKFLWRYNNEVLPSLIAYFNEGFFFTIGYRGFLRLWFGMVIWRCINVVFVLGLPRPPLYPFPGGQYAYSMLSPEMSQVAATW